MRINAPAPAITGDVCRVSVNMTVPGGQAINSYDYMANALGVVTSSVLVSLATAFETAVETALKAVLSQQATIISYVSAALSLSTPATAVVTSNHAGSVAQAPLPSEMAAVLRKTSLLKGQHGRGRVSIPAVPVTFTTPATSPDLLNNTATTAYATLETALLSSLTASGILFIPVISTRPTTPGDLVGHAQLVNNIITDVTLGTIRRRKPGRGS